MLGSHLGDHGPLGQGHKANGQRACPSCCVGGCDGVAGLEGLEGKVGVVDKDDQVVVEPSGGAAGVDVVVGRHVLLVADDVHVGGREGVFTPVDIASFYYQPHRGQFPV